jgi:hypothetical protein
MSDSTLTDQNCDTISIDLGNILMVGLNIFEIGGIIPLETNDDFLIRDIYRVDKIDNALIILDKVNEAIFIFDEKGKGTTVINQKGKGPKEYLFLKDYFLDKNERLINIPDVPRKRILKYDLKGIYQNILSLKSYIWHNFSINKGGDICFYFQERFNDVNGENNDIWIYKKTGAMKNKQFKCRSYMKELIPQNINNPMAFFNDTTYFLRRYDNYIYAFAGGDVFKRYYLNFGGNDYTKEIIIKDTDPNKDVFFSFDLPRSIENIFMTKTFVFFSITMQNRYFECYYDKTCKKTYVVLRYTFNGSNNIEPEMVIGATDDYFIYKVSALNFKKQVDYLKKQNFSKKDEIKILNNKIDSEDNPILLLYKPVFK